VARAGVAARSGEHLSACAGAGRRTALASTAGVRGRAAGAPGRPSARTRITSGGRAAATTADEQDLGAEEDRGSAAARAPSQG